MFYDKNRIFINICVFIILGICIFLLTTKHYNNVVEIPKPDPHDIREGDIVNIPNYGVEGVVVEYISGSNNQKFIVHLYPNTKTNILDVVLYRNEMYKKDETK